MYRFTVVLIRLGWVHTCNVTAYRNTVSWQCGRESWPRNVSKVGYAVRLRACLVCCRYLAVASKGWYGYGRSRCGRATCTCNVTAYRNTVSWQCGRKSWPRNVSKVGYAVTLRVCLVCCRYLAVASKGWYGYGRSMCGRATLRGRHVCSCSSMRIKMPSYCLVHNIVWSCNAPKVRAAL
jgi:hypothetical protein